MKTIGTVKQAQSAISKATQHDASKGITHDAQSKDWQSKRIASVSASLSMVADSTAKSSAIVRLAKKDIRSCLPTKKPTKANSKPVFKPLAKSNLQIATVAELKAQLKAITAELNAR